jgi:GrpB-like predicted nucleotidyltransferase (UPF0157 family)/ubiquinone/menaquinone biosynthesis C-methylase UbiE
VIAIVPYDPEWPREFERERDRLRDALGDLAVRIDHHGSTSVPGLAAKPIIDIQIAVAPLHPLDPYLEPLAQLGYHHVPHVDDAFAPFLHRPAEWPHTHHVHLVEAGGAEERRTLAFRDALRADAALARDYEALKRGLADASRGSEFTSQQAYAEAKTDFIEGAIARVAIDAYYNCYEEEERLASGPSQLERERTQEILARHLPPAPARILDVGGAAGVYGLWLAERGHEVHLVDRSARLVDEARRRSHGVARPLTSATVDARQLLQADASVDVVLVMGPLYHLTAAADRARALDEAYRVLKTDGLIAVAGISRYASALDGLAQNFALDPAFVAIRDRDLADGQHRNDAGHPHYFTTAYFHTPDDLRAEIAAAGFAGVRVVGVEGPAWLLPDFERRWRDPLMKDVILDTARALEAHQPIVAASAHLLGLGWKRG